MTEQRDHSDSHHAPATLDSRTARQLVSQLINGPSNSEPLDVQAILCQHPELQDHRSLVVDLIYEQLLRQQEAGQSVDWDQLAEAFPEYRDSLIEMRRVHEYLGAGDPLLTKWPEPGEDFLGYHIEEELGRGAFSRVYVAREAEVAGRPVVVKVCLFGSREIEALGRLQHPHVVPVYSVDHDDLSALTAICMPLLSRATLLDVVRRCFGGASPPDRAMQLVEVIRAINGEDNRLAQSAPEEEWLDQLAKTSYVEAVVRLGVELSDALAYTHQRGLLHCDVKPSNVLLTPDARAMLLDFNLAYPAQSEGAGLGGTLPYMAPEQLESVLQPERSGAAAVDGRTDLFSLGVTLYEALTGQLPFGPLPEDHNRDPNRKELAQQLLEQQRRGPRPLRELNRHVNRGLARLIESCLHLDPAARPASADQLADQLRRQLALPPRVARRLIRRRRWVATASCLMVLVAAVLLGLALTREPRSRWALAAGRQALRQGQYDEAIEQLTRSLRDDPSSLTARFYRGRAYMLEGDFAQAKLDFQELRDRLEQPNGKVLACLAHCLAGELGAEQQMSATGLQHTQASGLQRAAALRRAAALYSKALQLGTATAGIYNNLGCCYFKLGSFDRAETALHKAAQLGSPFQSTYLALAMCDLRRAALERRPPQLVWIEKALDLGPGSAELYLQAACAFASQAAAVAATDAQARDQWLGRALKCCARAIDQGADPAELKKVASFWPAIEQRSDFQKLKQRPRPQQPPVAVQWMVDPLAGLQDEPF